MLRAADLGVMLYGVTITSGDAVTQAGGELRVPKRDLVAKLQVLFQNGSLRIARGLPLADLVTRELLNFKVKVTAGANETFEAWRAGDHDDFVLALAIACWVSALSEGAEAFMEFYLEPHRQRHERGDYRTGQIDGATGRAIEECGIRDCAYRLRPEPAGEPGDATPWHR